MHKTGRNRGALLIGTSRPLASGGIQLQGFTTLNTLIEIGFLEPQQLANSSLNDLRADPVARANKLLRDSIQRPFNAARQRNSVAYSRHIIRTEVDGKKGNSPAITLYTPRVVPETDGLIIPHGAPLIAVDGETQSQARFMVASEYPETADQEFKITVFGNEPEEYARIILVEYNANGTKVQKAIIKQCDPRGYVNQSLKLVCQRARLELSAHIKRFGKINGAQYATQEQLQAGVIGAALGAELPWKLHFDDLNTDGFGSSDDKSIPEKFIDVVAEILDAAAAGSSALRRADPLLWQAIASLMVTGRRLDSLNISGTLPAEKIARERAANRRLSASDKLTAITKAL